MCCLYISHDIYCSCFMLLSKQVPTPLTWAYLTQLDTRECSWQGYINGSKEPRRERQLRNSCEAAKRRWAWLTWVLSTFLVGPRDMSSLFQSPNSHPFLLSIVLLLVGRQGSISNLWLIVTTLNLNELFDMQNASKCFFSDTEKDGQGDGIAFTVIPSHFLSISSVFLRDYVKQSLITLRQT